MESVAESIRYFFGGLFALVHILTILGTVVFIVTLVPSLLFPRSRSFCSKGIVVVTYLWGASLWIYSGYTVLQLWGIWAFIIGVAIAGIGTVPLACLALLFNGEILPALGIGLGSALIYRVRLFGFWVLINAEEQTKTID